MVKKNRGQRANILKQAAALFWNKGYEKTSIRDVARSCGFETSNLYYYFPKKEHILYAVMGQDYNQMALQIRSKVTENLSPVERLRLLIKIHVSVLLGTGMSSSGLLSDSELKSLSPGHRRRLIVQRDMYDNTLRKIIRDGIDLGDFREIDEKLASFAIASIIIRSRIWFSPSGKYTPEEIANFVFEFVIRALKGDKGSLLDTKTCVAIEQQRNEPLKTG